ncbi:MAG: hypothetical protein AB1634_01245 [Thermodesulfobacteriota bacterium]
MLAALLESPAFYFGLYILSTAGLTLFWRNLAKGRAPRSIR